MSTTNQLPSATEATSPTTTKYGTTATRSITVPFGGVCGYAPGKIPAYSNGNDEHFSNTSNYDTHFFTGYQWQCVEFSRRWLLERKGLVLPQYFIAAHIIYGEKVGDLEGNLVDAHVVRNGHSTEPPTADSLIIYPSSKKNVVGHVGVITEVGPDYVRVADQNRFFHHWGDKHYSAEFPLLRREDGTFVIDDPVIQCSGWISFPGYPNRPDGEKLIIPESLKAPPKSWFPRHLHFVWRGIREHYWGVTKPAEKKEASDKSSCCFFGKGTAVVSPAAEVPEQREENTLVSGNDKRVD